MAEIKSTLDIIMEKAKKLTVSEEEKVAFKRKELEGKIRGLVLKYLESFIDLDRLKAELTPLQEEEKEMVREILKEDVLSRIQLGQNNDPLLNMLSNTIGMNIASIKELLNQFEKRMDREKESRKKILEEELRKRGISGSAVIPNLDADKTWIKTLSEAAQEFREELKRINPR
jgi:hypothetical protein